MSEIASSYLDAWERQRKIDPAVRRSLLKALGPRKRIAGRIALRSARCHQPEVLERGGRIWGFAVQLYGIRSQRNWGIGDFGDLRALLEIAAGFGASLVGVSPLHAGGTSPYSPSSRHALDPLYLDVEAIPEYAKEDSFRERIEKLRQAALVDYAGVAALKYEVLGRVFARFQRDRARRRRFAEFWRKSPKGLRDYARFEARKGGSVEFHAWLQWNARLQLDAAQRRSRELGMPVGLYFDLALGADRGGAEVWSAPALFAAGVSCGAPPDDFNPRGQDWGLPPYSPRALRAAAYRPFIELLRANMPAGGALRLDHVMALARLYWIPRGARADQGGYVNYPFRDLLAILARESRRSRCLVVGEDLGTVPSELRAALNAAGVLSYRPLIFEKDASGEFCPPSAYPREALVCASTHDLPTWRGYWSGRDIELRMQLGLSVDPENEKSQRENDKKRLARALERDGFDTSAASAHAFLARTPSKIAMVQPEDVFEVLEQANLPGTVEAHPNWRRKLPVALEQWRSDPRMVLLSETMSERAFSSGKSFPPPRRVPVATYRLQLHEQFRFADATALVPYLARLGVSHVYASPFLKARPGSVHGYDIVDHGRLNPEIGAEADFDKLLGALRRHGMGLVLDVVPNHMGVLHADNPWWQDVLEHGRASRYARFFDIDWSRGKLLLPVLGRHYGEALDAGEIRLVRERGKWRVAYFEQRFPLHGTVKATKDPLLLHRILERQHYRLAYWRVASDEINYRRFFEIADLAALRMEDRAVFDATHALIARLARRAGVDGVRVDHPDGLSDPAQYLERLAGLFDRPWLLVEKIRADYEALPADWPVHGTTGYRFASLLTGLFIDAQAAARFDRIYQRFTGEQRPFGEIAYQSRRLIMNTTLAAELNLLTARLARIAAGNRRTRDYTASGLRRALAEVAARFPVYRTYVTARGASETDRRYIEWAVKAARRASREADPGVFDFVQAVLTLDGAPRAGSRRRAMLEFALRFQQLTAPVAAKGVEDTAFYRYPRLAALNEVGSDPRNFGFSLKAFHAAAQDRARRWPYTMLGSSTHDTKSSEDARARLGALSELASAWRLWLRRWSTLNRSYRTQLDGEPAPSRGDEYLYYQALIGLWPDLDRERLRAYMLKAVREAKARSSWINPDLEYEAALERFVLQSLDNALFRKDLDEALPRLARLGMLAGLSQALLKVASPGVPDYYQGTELWDFSLVDPDNRRAVDFVIRRELFEQLERGSPFLGEMLQNLPNGKAKLHVIRQGLALRRAHPLLFHGGKYVPLYADAGREENVCAFALRRERQAIVAVAPRLFARLMKEGDLAPLGGQAWGDAKILLGMSGEFESVLTGERFETDGGLGLAALLREFPVALLVKL